MGNSNKDKISSMVNGVPKFADYIKANEKASEFNKAVVAVKQIQKEKDLTQKQNEILIQSLQAAQASKELEQLKTQIAQMLASMQQPLPIQPFEQTPNVYGGGPQMIPQSVMGEQQPNTMPMQESSGMANPMMA